MKRILVLMSAYNGSKYIKEQVLSIINQKTQNDVTIRIRDDGSVDEISYVKNNIKIVFQEDLREHITNLYIIDFQKKIGKIHYRDIMLDNGLTGVDKLKNALSLLKNNAEKREIEIYIEFLQTNNII